MSEFPVSTRKPTFLERRMFPSINQSQVCPAHIALSKRIAIKLLKHTCTCRCLSSVQTGILRECCLLFIPVTLNACNNSGASMSGAFS